MKDLFEKLLTLLKDRTRVVFMGIGEIKMSDDGVGPYIISELLSYSNDKFLFINAGINPIARIDEVMNFNPSHLILLDTCTLNKPPGTVAILKRENIREFVPISSHTIPIQIVIDLLIEKIPKLSVFMIGFIPESLKGFEELKLYKEDAISLDELNENQDLPFFEINLTEKIKKAADQVIEIIKELIIRR